MTRLSSETLTSLRDAAYGGHVHPVDVIRLVDEVEDLKRILEETRGAMNPTPNQNVPVVATGTGLCGEGAPVTDDTDEFPSLPDSVGPTEPAPVDPPVVGYVASVSTDGNPDRVVYTDPRYSPAPQQHTRSWDGNPLPPGSVTSFGTVRALDLSIPDMLYLLNAPTPLSKNQYEELIAELDRRGYKLGGGKQPAPTVSSKVPDGDAPTIVET